jgi:hypothetical protein
MTALLIAVLVGTSVYAARRWVMPFAPTNPRDQVDAFTRARAVTRRWAEDPQATPAPLKEYLAQQHAEREE